MAAFLCPTLLHLLHPPIQRIDSSHPSSPPRLSPHPSPPPLNSPKLATNTIASDMDYFLRIISTLLFIVIQPGGAVCEVFDEFVGALWDVSFCILEGVRGGWVGWGDEGRAGGRGAMGCEREGRSGRGWGGGTYLKLMNRNVTHACDPLLQLDLGIYQFRWCNCFG